jgi:hypothetical protein
MNYLKYYLLPIDAKERVAKPLVNNIHRGNNETLNGAKE